MVALMFKRAKSALSYDKFVHFVAAVKKVTV
jgi:hypothetical protein